MGEGDDDSGSLDSDSDLILDGGGAENAAGGAVGGAAANMMDSDEDDDDELEVNEMAAETLKNRKSAKPSNGVLNGANAAAAINSDDDF